jgi:hypothetical protein
MSHNYNTPAFPHAAIVNGDTGLTKLEYFTAMAMQGLCAAPTFPPSADQLAENALTVAKSTLDALEKESQ